MAGVSNGEMSRFRHNSAGGVFFQQGVSSRAVTSAVGNRHGHLEREAAGVFSQKGTASAGAGHDLLGFLAAGDF